MKYHINTGEIIEVADEIIGKGGEANIYKIISPVKYKNLVLKIYKKPIEQLKRKKIEYLINSFTFDKSTPKKIINSIILPKHLVYNDNDTIIGYSMDIVENKILLRDVQLNTLNDSYAMLKLFKYNKNAYLNRLKIIYNLVQVIKALHYNNIVLVDTKPDNIFISQNAEVTFIDIDGCQIYSKNNNIFYPADALTDEYSPIEKINFKNTRVDTSWDLFILGVMAYQLLFRIHPYNLGPSNGYESQNDYKKNCMFAHGDFIPKAPLNPAHNDFNNIDGSLQQLFMECLNKGCKEPHARPSLEEWEEVLSELIKNQPLNIYTWNYGIFIKPSLMNSKKIVFSKAIMSHKITQNKYNITISWDIKNAKKAYVGYSLISYKGYYLSIENMKEISFKSSLELPIISTYFKFILINNNDDEQVFDVKFAC